MSDPFFFLKFQFLHCWINGKTPTKHTRGSFFRFFFLPDLSPCFSFVACRREAWVEVDPNFLGYLHVQEVVSGAQWTTLTGLTA